MHTMNGFEATKLIRADEKNIEKLPYRLLA